MVTLSLLITIIAWQQADIPAKGLPTSSAWESLSVRSSTSMACEVQDIIARLSHVSRSQPLRTFELLVVVNTWQKNALKQIELQSHLDPAYLPRLCTPLWVLLPPSFFWRINATCLLPQQIFGDGAFQKRLGRKPAAAKKIPLPAAHLMVGAMTTSKVL